MLKLPTHSGLNVLFLSTKTRKSAVEPELFTLPEHLSSLPVFSGIRVTRSLVLCVCFVDRCLSFCTFSFGHCVVCSSSIYGLHVSILPLFLRSVNDIDLFYLCFYDLSMILIYFTSVSTICQWYLSILPLFLRSVNDICFNCSDCVICFVFNFNTEIDWFCLFIYLWVLTFPL
jgi:hypothetical protein